MRTLALVHAAAAALALAAPLGAASADTPAPLPTEALGQVVTLPEQPGPHWVWVSDYVFHRTALVDAGSGRFLGMLASGAGFVVTPQFSPDGREIYLAETHYARTTRGARTDVVSVYDARTLFPVAEIEIPPKRGDPSSGNATSALSDDGRFLAVFNMTPATSLSIVDVRERRFTAEIETPGCSLVYAAGPRRFLSLCGDGSALVVGVDDAGREASKRRTAPFFDPEQDPVTEKAVRAGDEWLFVSFAGVVTPVDVSGPELRFGSTWRLAEGEDAEAGWRVGGAQLLALHEASGTLYALMHQGGIDTHKQPGTEVWAYDLAQRVRTRRIAVRSPNAVFLREVLRLDGPGLGARLAGRLLDAALPNPGAERIWVSQDAEPVLVTSSSFPPTLSVMDARSGAWLRDVKEIGIAAGFLTGPR